MSWTSFSAPLAEFGAGLEVDHERTACLHGGEAGIDAVGQAALFSHLVHQAGAEAAAAEDLVAQVERRVVGILAVDAKLGEHQVGLLGGEVDVRQAGLGRFRLDGLGQRRALGQRLGDFRGDRFGLLPREVADQRDDHVAGGVGLLVERLQLFAADRWNGLFVAVAGVRVGMLAIEALEQLQAGQLAGVLLLVLETGQDLVLDACQSVLGEGRLADHLFEQLQRLGPLVGIGQAAQAGHRHVAVGAVAERGAEVLEAGGDGSGVLARHAFVEHGVGQHRQAGGAGVLAAAGGEGQAQVEHRQFMGFDEQHLGTFGGLPFLDVQLAMDRRLLGDVLQRLQLVFLDRRGMGRRRGLGGRATK